MRTKLRIACGVLLSGCLLAVTSFAAPSTQPIRTVRLGSTPARQTVALTTHTKADDEDAEQEAEEASASSGKKSAVGSGVRNPSSKTAKTSNENKRNVQTVQARMPAQQARMSAPRTTGATMTGRPGNRLPASMATRKVASHQETRHQETRHQETIEPMESDNKSSESVPLDGDEYFDESMDGGCAGGCGGCGGGCMGDGCGGWAYGGIGYRGCGGCGSCVQCCLVPCPRIPWENLEVFAGVQAFTGPTNRGGSGSFGFTQGANIGGQLPLTPYGEIGWQLGARATQSNLSGSSISELERDQAFVTAGLFRRVDWGLQGGVVIDYLAEDWYYTGDFAQIRGELSWVLPCSSEFGYWFTAAARDATVQSTFTSGGEQVTITETYGATDLHAFFYRHRFGECESSNVRAYAGLSGEGDGLLGADMHLTFCCNWALQGGFAYLIPNESKGSTIDDGHAQESWNLGLNLVWVPGGSSRKNYYRPLFNVADNGNFMMDRR